MLNKCLKMPFLLKGGIFFIFIFSFTQIDAQTTNPLQSLNYGIAGQNNNWNYNLGYRFTANANGSVTQLGGRWRNGVIHTVRLYDYTAGGTLLASINVTGNMNWSYANLATPVTLVEGNQYVVAVRLDAQSSGMYSNGISLPTQSGNITIENATYINNSNAMPTNSVTNAMYGQADITFQTCNNGGKSSSSATALCGSGTVNLSLSEYSVGSSIQWQQAVGGGVFSDISGATTANYTTGTLTASNSYSFRAKVTNGCTSFSDTTNVYVSTNTGTNTVPNNESLETNFGIWNNSSADNNDWIRNSGATPSNNTGPTTASDGSFYAFVEASNPNFNSTAILEASFDFTSISSPELSFDYHMFGVDMGSLSVVVNGSTVWNISGQQQTSSAAAWTNQIIDLSAYANSCYALIQFVSNTGNNYRSDIGLDNITIYNRCNIIAGNAEISSSAFCTANSVDLILSGYDIGSTIQWQQAVGGGVFSDISGATTANYTTGTLTASNSYSFRAKVTNGCTSFSDTTNVYVSTNTGTNTVPNNESLETNFGIWNNSSADNNDWIRNSGATPSNNTGPTTASDGSFYAFVEASNPNFNSTAILEASFDFTSISSPELSFDYHMFGVDMGSLSVVVNGSTVWNISGQQQTSSAAAWTNQIIDLSAYANSCYALIQFVSNTGNNYTSDIALDNITIYNRAYIWTGTTSTDWSVGNNWSTNTVPPTSANILIRNTTYQPVLDQNRTIGNLTIEPSASVDLNGFELNIEKSLDSKGNLIPNNGSLVFNGNNTQFINTNSDLDIYNITINNPNGVSISTGNINLTGTLTLTNGNFNTNDALTLVSDASGTARIAEITGGSISGNITMQRYINAGSTSWRFLTPAVSNATIADFNDDFITSGFTGSDYPNWPSAANPWASIYFYDETVPGLQDSGYVAATNVTNTIAVGEGIWAWSGDSAGGTQAFTIDVTGPTNTGNINLPISYTNTGSSADDGWNMVGNPYPSTIDWDDNVSITKTGINNAIYIWNPELEQFASYSGGLGTNGGSRYIASSQAFWVQANATGASVQITESAKAANDAPFLKLQSTNTPLIINVNSNNGSDQTIINFNNDATQSFDPMYDALKIHSTNTNLPTVTTLDINNTEFSINQIPAQEIAIPLKVTTGVAGMHSISFDGLDQFDNAACVIVEDLFTGKSYDLKKQNSFACYINSATTSARFLIKFGANTTVTATNASCYGSNDGAILFEKEGNNSFDIVWKDQSDNIIASNTNMVGGDALNNLSAGVYTINATDEICGNTTQIVTLTAPEKITALFDTDRDTVFLSDGATVIFTNSSSNANTYVWDFGDGNSAYISDPTHQFTEPGIYNITLEASLNGNCGEIDTKNITVLDQTTSIEHKTINETNTKTWIYNNTLFVESTEIINKIEIRNINGQLLIVIDNKNMKKNSTSLNHLASQLLVITTFSSKNISSNKIRYIK